MFSQQFMYKSVYNFFHATLQADFRSKPLNQYLSSLMRQVKFLEKSH